MPRARRPSLPQTEEALLDSAVELTFPASDPVAIEHAYQSARRRRQQRERLAAPASSGASRQQPTKPSRKR